MAISNVGDIKKFLDSDIAGGPTARPVTMDEMRRLSEDDKQELGDMSRNALASAGLPHSLA